MQMHLIYMQLHTPVKRLAAHGRATIPPVMGIGTPVVAG
jgi:hypothetical protein